MDLATAYGVSKSPVFQSRNILNDAVNTCNTLKIAFPEKRKIQKQYRQEIKPRVYTVL